jgi:hypothetical protein
MIFGLPRNPANGRSHTECWSCRPSLKKDNEIFGLTTGDRLSMAKVLDGRNRMLEQARTGSRAVSGI